MKESAALLRHHPLSALSPSAAALFSGAAVLSVHTTFASAQPVWCSLQRDCSGYGFQAFEWLQTWHAQLGQSQGWQPRIVVVSDGMQRPLLLLPLGIRRQHGVRVLSLLGGEVTDYQAPLLHPDFPAPALALLWPALLRLLRAEADLLRVRRMPQSIEGVANPLAQLPGMQASERAHAATLDLSWPAFQQARSAKMFADTRRQLRRLQQLGEVQLLVDTAAPQRAAVIAAMARQKARRWRETGSRDLFAEPGYLAFYQNLAGQAIEGGAIMVSALYVGNEVVASHWGMRYGQRFYWLMPGYEEGQWSRYSVGRILMDGVVQHCIAQGLAVFDLTVGDEAYKMQWADHTIALFSGQQGLTLRGRAVVCVSSRWQRLRAWLRGQRHVRNLVRRLRGRAPLPS